MTKTTKRKCLSNLHTAEWLEESETCLIAKIPCNDWIQIPRYPHQPVEYTERKAETGVHWKYLATAQKPIQTYLSHVTAALLNDDLYKLDGHARTVHWETGLLNKPNQVFVNIYIVDSMREMIDLFNVIHGGRRFGYENIIAVCDELDINLKSQRFKHGFFLDALNIALRGDPRSQQDKRTHRSEIDLSKSLHVFKEELQLLDQLDPPKEVFLTGIVAAGLIMLAIKKDYLEFFRCLANKEGEIKDGKSNPVEALLSAIDKYRLLNQNSAARQGDLCKRTIRALLAWEAGPDVSGYWMKTILRTTDHMPYIREMKRVKGIVKDRDL